MHALAGALACSYHRVVNGMVERLHRRLKALLVSKIAEWKTYQWLNFKPNINSNLAEWVYETMVSLPGEIGNPTPTTPRASFTNCATISQPFTPCSPTAIVASFTYRPAS